jgi:DNA uptake protein ComE-like DNA-binding protein
MTRARLQPTSMRDRNGFATLMVLWTIALVALVLVAIQSSSFRQAAAGRETVARVRAYWAARAGVEAQIARLTMNTLSPDTSAATSMNSDLASVARGDLTGSSFSVRHFDGTAEVDGPEDAHSKINVNTATTDDLMLLDAMDETTAASIHNWIHGFDETTGMGADEGTYTGKHYPYKPRGAAVRSLKELELVEGVDPKLLRGEDANYNGRLDPSEDDGDASLPPDNADGLMDAGWSRYLTAVSESDRITSYGPSGTKKLDLATATVSDIASRLNVDQNQAQAISTHATNGSATLADYVRTDLSTLAQSAQAATLLNGRQQQTTVTALSRDQLRLLLDECVIGPEIASAGPRTGKININTVTRETLERYAAIEAISPDLTETILTERDGRSGGFLSLVDLLDIPAITNDVLADLMAHIDVKSNVFVVSSRGRDKNSGREVEITAVLDRSSIPVIIRDLVVR